MSNWQLVGGDPAPGDVATIKMRVGHLDRAAEALEEASIELSRISRGSSEAAWRGKAADQMRDVLDSYRHDLRPIANSFRSVGRALARYADDLGDLQARARQALRRAKVAEAQQASAERDRKTASTLLAQQRQTLAARRRAEVHHAASSTVTSLLDPGAAAANSQERARLTQLTHRAEASERETTNRVRAIEFRISTAQADLRSARSTTSAIKKEWDQRSRGTARIVDDSLADHLRNQSWLEKVIKFPGEAFEAIGRFVDDPLPYIAELHKALDIAQSFVSKFATVVSIAAKVVAIIPGLQHVAAALGAIAAVATVAVLALAAAKFATSAILWGNGYPGPDGKPMVGAGDLLLSGVDLVTSVGAVKGAKGGIDTLRRSTKVAKDTGSWVSPTAINKKITWHVTKGKAKDLAVDQANGYIKKETVGQVKAHVREEVRVRLNDLDHDARWGVPVPQCAPVRAPVGGGAGGGGW